MSMARPKQLYEADFYAWTQEQARELRRLARTRPDVPLDLAHIAEEIQDLGKSEYKAAAVTLPAECPYTLDQVLSAWLPEGVPTSP